MERHHKLIAAILILAVSCSIVVFSKNRRSLDPPKDALESSLDANFENDPSEPTEEYEEVEGAADFDENEYDIIAEINRKDFDRGDEIKKYDNFTVNKAGRDPTEDILVYPVAWSTDSKQFYYLASYYDLEGLPIEVWQYEDGKKQRIGELSYRSEYNYYHLGFDIMNPMWSPSKDKLAFILQHCWGSFHELVILDVKTKKITTYDNIIAFDWHKNQDKLLVVKLIDREESLKNNVMECDPKTGQLEESSLSISDISSITYDKDGNMYYADLNTAKVFRVDKSGQKTYIGPGHGLVPSLDRTFIVLDSINNSDSSKITLYNTENHQTTEMSGRNVSHISWGLDNTLQLTTRLDGLIYIDKDGDKREVKVYDSIGPAPDNETFLVEVTRGQFITELAYIVRPKDTD